MGEQIFQSVYATQPRWDAVQGAYRINLYFDTGEVDALHTRSREAAVRYTNWFDNWQRLVERVTA
jgi:hypothetical protein